MRFKLEKGCEHILDEYNMYCKKCKQRFLYDNGFPITNKLMENIEDLKRRINLNKASLLVIDGGVGEGKTTLAVHVAEHFQKRQLNFKHQLAKGGDEFQEKLQICIDLELPVLIYDEAGDFNTRGALTKFNQMLTRVFETYRTYRILVILCLPKFFRLDNSLFDNEIPRGLLHAYGRNRKYGRIAGYSLYRMYYLKSKVKDITVTPHIYNMTTPNFRGLFLDLKPARSNELNKVSTESKQNILTTNIISARGQVSLKSIAKQIGRSTKWCSLKLKSWKVKESTIYKREKYYDKEIIPRLESEKKT